MLARAQIPVALPLCAALAVALSACDLSQKKPETITTLVVSQRVGDSGATAGEEAQADSEGAGPDRSGERSIRLYGPGVSRERQTRI